MVVSCSGIENDCTVVTTNQKRQQKNTSFLLVNGSLLKCFLVVVGISSVLLLVLSVLDHHDSINNKQNYFMNKSNSYNEEKNNYNDENNLRLFNFNNDNDEKTVTATTSIHQNIHRRLLLLLPIVNDMKGPDGLPGLPPPPDVPNDHAPHHHHHKDHPKDVHEHEGKSNSTTSSNTTTVSAIDENEQLLEQQSTSNNGKPKLFPLQYKDYWGIIFCILGLLLASGGGIGGGGILVPIFVLVIHLNAKYAIPLSSITVFGGAIANTLVNIQKIHPSFTLNSSSTSTSTSTSTNKKYTRPLIDWDIVLLMEPLTIVGTFFGTMFNKILPEIVLLISLVLLLAITSYETLQKASKMYNKETITINKKKQEQQTASTNVSETTKLIPSSTTSVTNPIQQQQQQQQQQQSISIELENLLEEESHIPKRSFCVLIGTVSIILLSNVSKIYISCGSILYLVVSILQIVLLIVVAVDTRYYLLQKHTKRLQVTNYPFIETDIHWDTNNTILYPCYCIGAGFAAGLFGIGGGMVQGPLLLALNVHPAVSSGCLSIMILITSITATTNFILYNLLLIDYGITFCIIGFIATMIGQVGLSIIMKHNQRNSYIAYSIGLVVVISTILMTIQSIIAMTSTSSSSTQEHVSHSGSVCG